MKLNTLVAALVGALALTLGTAPNGSLSWLNSASAQAVRPEVGKHLKDAQALLKGAKYREALAKLRDAEGVSGRNADENAYIEQLRLAAAQGAGEPDTMVKAFEALKAAGKVGAAQNLQYLEAIAGTYSRANQHAKALQWANRYFSEGGTSAAMKQVQTAAQYNSGDLGPIIKATMAEIQAAEKAGQVPPRDKLNLLLNAASRAKDGAAESYGAEKLLQYYPSKEIWASALATVAVRKGFSPRFQLDLYRLRLLTDNLRGVDDYMELANLAGQAGFADEGRRVVEAGFKAGVLGQGKDAERHNRLKAFMDKKVADAKAGFEASLKAARESKSGDPLVPLGLYLAQSGKAKDGVALIEEGIAKGQLKREEDAKLALGLAHFWAGEGAKAQQAWRGVKGTDGAADVARLWSIYARSAKK